MVYNVFLLISVLVCIVSIAHSFHASSNRIQKTSMGTKHPTSLLMSKASQEKADEKKRKQAMVKSMHISLLGDWSFSIDHVLTIS